MNSVLIVGSSSNLSFAIQSFCRRNGIPFSVIPTYETRSWNSSEIVINQKVLSSVRAHLDLIQFDRIIWTIGLTNSHSSPSELDFVNVTFPITFAKIIGTTNFTGPTLFPGALMENFDLLSGDSPYLKSKRRFSEKLSIVDSNWVNLRFSVWYGKERIKTHLFLGSLISALRMNSDFQMSNGLQLREYHHIDDDVQALFVDFGRLSQVHLNVAHGETYTLGQIAERIFSSVGKLNLLRLGALPSNPNENYNVYFEPPEIFRNLSFRPTFPSLIEYVLDKSIEGI